MGALAPHIYARHAGLPLETVLVEWTNDGKFVDGRDYLEINPKGKVPALEADGITITETQVILQHLAGLDADQPIARGATVDWRLLETLNFVATEIHKAFSPLWLPSMKEGSARAEQLGVLTRNFQVFEGLLGDHDYLMGDHFSVADAYAFTVLGWCDVHDIDLTDFAALRRYRERISRLPAVQQALREQRPPL